MAFSKGVDQWIHISIGSLTIETGIETDYYAPDVMRDAWTQAVTGLREVIQTAGELGLVQYATEDEDDEDDDT